MGGLRLAALAALAVVGVEGLASKVQHAIEKLQALEAHDSLERMKEDRAAAGVFEGARPAPTSLDAQASLLAAESPAPQSADYNAGFAAGEAAQATTDAGGPATTLAPAVLPADPYASPEPSHPLPSPLPPYSANSTWPAGALGGTYDGPKDPEYDYAYDEPLDPASEGSDANYLPTKTKLLASTGKATRKRRVRRGDEQKRKQLDDILHEALLAGRS